MTMTEAPLPSWKDGSAKQAILGFVIGFILLRDCQIASVISE